MELHLHLSVHFTNWITQLHLDCGDVEHVELLDFRPHWHETNEWRFPTVLKQHILFLDRMSKYYGNHIKSAPG